MATKGGGARDAAARRRRIAERGAERLALITGRVQSTSSSSSPPPPSVAQPHHSSTALPSPDKLPLYDENNDSPLKTEPANVDVSNDDQITETSVHTSSAPITTQSSPTTITEETPLISTSNISQKSKSQTNLGQTPLISTSNNSQKSKSQANLSQTLTPNRLRPAITATQNTRTNCSIIAALLVLLSYAGFPILGSNNIIKYIILSRPLVLLLLTNITIVAAPVLLEKVDRVGHRGSSTGEVGFADHLGMALEWGKLIKAGLSALFMDCSVYSVVVVCGMSFLQKFGW